MITLQIEPNSDSFALSFTKMINDPKIDTQKLINQLSQAKRDAKKYAKHRGKGDQELLHKLEVYKKWSSYIREMPGC